MSTEFGERIEGELSAKVALITGAASGIGLAITRRFLKEKALVAMLDFNVEKLNSSKAELLEMDGTARILSLRCDITNEADVISAVQETRNHFGRLDIAVNDAGVAVSVPSDECTLEQWNWVMNVNCTGSFLISGKPSRFFNAGNWGCPGFCQQRQRPQAQSALFGLQRIQGSGPADGAHHCQRVWPVSYSRQQCSAGCSFSGAALCGRRTCARPGRISRI